MSAEEVFIVGACRTAIGSLNGALSSLPAHQLGSVAIKAALDRSGVPYEKVSEVLIGQVLTAGQGQNPARQAAMNAGIPQEVPSTTVNMLCGSGKTSQTRHVKYKNKNYKLPPPYHEIIFSDTKL